MQNLGFTKLIKKKIGRYYGVESQILLSGKSIVPRELIKRLYDITIYQNRLSIGG